MVAEGGARAFGLVASGAASFESDEKRILVELQIGGQNPAQLQDGEMVVTAAGFLQAQRPGVRHASRQAGTFKLQGERLPAQLEPYAGDEQPGANVLGEGGVAAVGGVVQVGTRNRAVVGLSRLRPSARA